MDVFVDLKISAFRGHMVRFPGMFFLTNSDTLYKRLDFTNAVFPLSFYVSAVHTVKV